jgi:hypothetical protein
VSMPKYNFICDPCNRASCPHVTEGMCSWKYICIVKFHNTNPLFSLTSILQMEMCSCGILSSQSFNKNTLC